MSYTVKKHDGGILAVLGDQERFDTIADLLKFARKKVAPAPDDNPEDHVYDTYRFFVIRQEDKKYVYETMYRDVVANVPRDYFPAEDYPIFFYKIDGLDCDLCYINRNVFLGTYWDSEIEGEYINESKVETLLEAFDYNSQNFDSIDCCMEFMRKYREYREFYASLQYEEIEEDGEKFDAYWLTVFPRDGTTRIGWNDTGFEFGFSWSYKPKNEFWTTGEKFLISEQKLRELLDIKANKSL